MTPVMVLASDLPPRALRLVVEWAILREEELLKNWQVVRAGQPPLKIAPLE